MNKVLKQSCPHWTQCRFRFISWNSPCKTTEWTEFFPSHRHSSQQPYFNNMSLLKTHFITSEVQRQLEKSYNFVLVLIQKVINIKTYIHTRNNCSDKINNKNIFATHCLLAHYSLECRCPIIFKRLTLTYCLAAQSHSSYHKKVKLLN